MERKDLFNVHVAYEGATWVIATAENEEVANQIKAYLEKTTGKKGFEFFKILQRSAEYKHDFIGSLTKILENTIQFAIENPDFYRFQCSQNAACFESEAGKIYEPFFHKIQSLFSDFFQNSSNEIGNMKGKELLFSKIFFQTSQAVALEVIQNRLEKTDNMIFSVIHSFVYGVVAG